MPRAMLRIGLGEAGEVGAVAGAVTNIRTVETVLSVGTS